MAEAKEVEHVYTIPLRAAYEKSMRIRSRYAIDIIRGFLATHLKGKEVKLGSRLNEAVWSRGMKKPPRKIKVSAIKEGDVVKAELFGHKYEEFKAMPKKERKGMKEKMMERLSPLAAKKEAEEKMIEGKESKEEKKVDVQPTETATPAPAAEKTEETKLKIAKGKKAKEAKKE